MPLSLADILPAPIHGFRPATLADAPLLRQWRTQAEAQAWWNGTPTSMADHVEWLQARIDNPLVRLLVWEEDGEPVGTVRVDSNGEFAFDAADDETAVRMLHAAAVYAGEYGRRLKATLDADDPKWRLLKQVGFVEYPAYSMVYKP